MEDELRYNLQPIGWHSVVLSLHVIPVKGITYYIIKEIQIKFDQNWSDIEIDITLKDQTLKA